MVIRLGPVLVDLFQSLEADLFRPLEADFPVEDCMDVGADTVADTVACIGFVAHCCDIDLDRCE